MIYLNNLAKYTDVAAKYVQYLTGTNMRARYQATKTEKVAEI